MEEDSLNVPQTQEMDGDGDQQNHDDAGGDMDDYGQEGRASAEMVVEGDMDDDMDGDGDPYGDEMDMEDGIPVNNSEHADLN